MCCPLRKHDTDNNLKLDGLELLKAIAGMDGQSTSCIIMPGQALPPAGLHMGESVSERVTEALRNIRESNAAHMAKTLELGGQILIMAFA